MIQRFLRQVEIWRFLRHPNVLQLLGIAYIDNFLCSVSHVSVYDVPPGLNDVLSRSGQSIYGIRQHHSIPQNPPRSSSNPSPQRDSLWRVRFLCVTATVLIVHQLPNIYIHAESFTGIYEGWALLTYKPAFEYLMKDDRQMSCFPETATHISQISAVPVLKGYE